MFLIFVSLKVLIKTPFLLTEPVESPIIESLIKTDPQPSILNVFSSQGGLSILAQHMALLYPDTSHQVSVTRKS